jgi:hypothetical protein
MDVGGNAGVAGGGRPVGHDGLPPRLNHEEQHLVSKVSTRLGEAQKACGLALGEYLLSGLRVYSSPRGRQFSGLHRTLGLRERDEALAVVRKWPSIRHRTGRSLGMHELACRSRPRWSRLNHERTGTCHSRGVERDFGCLRPLDPGRQKTRRPLFRVTRRRTLTCQNAKTPGWHPGFT